MLCNSADNPNAAAIFVFSSKRHMELEPLFGVARPWSLRLKLHRKRFRGCFKSKGWRLTLRVADTDTNEVKSKAPVHGGSSFHQLLGIKETAQETNLEIEEKINKIWWCQSANGALFLLYTNDKTIKFWKEEEII